MLESDFFPLAENQDKVQNYWFMQDGPFLASSHCRFLDYSKTFDGGIDCPSFSPDLNLCDFFLWGYLKAKVWAGNPKIIDKLKGAITREVRQIPIAIFENVTSGFSNRLTAVISKEGGHFEHLYH